MWHIIVYFIAVSDVYLKFKWGGAVFTHHARLETWFHLLHEDLPPQLEEVLAVLHATRVLHLSRGCVILLVPRFGGTNEMHHLHILLESGLKYVDISRQINLELYAIN